MSTNSASSATRRADPNEVERVPLLPPLDGITPHDELWLPDGNLILVARNVAFRVYRCLLSFQSMVFADMFAMAMMDADETFEGCPIVHLSNSPEDLTYLFRVLLPKSHRGFYLRGTEVKHSFNEVSALVRLSHKYDIQDVKTQALDWMCQRYTSKFERWQLQRHPQLIANSGLPTTVPPVHSIGVVNVARLTNTGSLLPTALYSCCELGPTPPTWEDVAPRSDRKARDEPSAFVNLMVA